MTRPTVTRADDRHAVAEALREALAEPRKRVAIVVMDAETELASTALPPGSRALVWDGDRQELLAAMRQSLDDGGDGSESDLGEIPGMSRLTPRQIDVMRLAVQGRSLRDIASELGISPKTVEYHKYRMMETLGVKTTAELIRLSVEHESRRQSA